LLAEHYGFRELGYISGTVVFANCLGGAISPPLAGAIFDATQSYYWAFVACAALGLAAGFLILRLKPSPARIT
jgi:MFS family permease